MLRACGENLWFDEYDLMMPGVGFHFRGRMTVAKLSDGSVWLHSPIPIDDALAVEIDEIGPVKHLVAPNLFHHLHLKGVIERYPEATLYGVPGFEKKRPDLDFDHVLSSDAPVAWGGEFDQLLLKGAPSLNEMVFLHKPSGSLIVTDLVFNIQECKNWQSRLLFRLVGTYKRMAHSRSWRMIAKDKDALRKSVHKMLSWDFERVLMAHGEVVDQDAKSKLFIGMERLLGKTAALPAVTP